jgi:L-fucose isomerase-like protein
VVKGVNGARLGAVEARPAAFNTVRYNIIAGTVGKENTYGTVVGRVAPGPATFLRLFTLDTEGIIACLVAEGRFTDDEVNTFGGYGVAEIPLLRSLLRTIVQMGFEHHGAVTKAHVGQAVQEALGTYLGWQLV